MARGRTGKFRRLVEDFESALAELGGAMPAETVEGFLADRITSVAAHMGVTEATALRSYFTEDWGRDMAHRAWADHRQQVRDLDAAPALWMPVGLLARLVAALGQAQLFAARNSGPHTTLAQPEVGCRDAAAAQTGPAGQAWPVSTPSPDFDAAAASQATSGLGLALHGAGPGAVQVWVDGAVAVQTGQALVGFAAALRARRWSVCPCGHEHGQDEIADGVLGAVRADLAELETLIEVHDTTPRAPLMPVPST
ncbi:MAG: hypothetical protein L0I76_17745 [Pseudonocardia sp.]|nr:hypothetical protein [Pseudonocardia sp.]